MADYSELKRKAQEIKDEVKAGANTANRVGLALEETAKALEAENKRAEQAEESLENAVQMVQDNTEDLQSIRDEVERLGNDKADKSALEATNKEVTKKQNKLDNYKEDPSNGSVEIFAQDKVSVSNDSQGGVSCVEVYNEEDTAEGLIPVARMSADKDNGDYASVTVRGNEVHIEGDGVKVNGEDLESFRTTVVNDLTTGGADKALSAEMGKVLGVSVDDLEERIYDLGDFGRSSQAEAEAGKADIAGNPGIVLIRYTVGNKNGIILQQVGETITTQILLWDSVYQRLINFSGSDKTSVSSTSYWYKIGATHTSYDAETRCLHLQDMNYSNLNPSVDAVLPLASEAEAGLMSKEQVAKLRDVVGAIVSRESDGVELLGNGNIKLTLKGTTKEFMPATPSGDPMHYAYETAGAEYNATDDFILKDAPWKDMVDTIEDKAKWGFDVVDASQVKQMTIGGTTYNYVQTTRQSPDGTTEPRYFLVGQASDGTWVEDETKVLHLPGHWYLNGLGDITGKEMNNIYNAPRLNVGIDSLFSGNSIRTAIPGTQSGGEGTPFSLYYICANSDIVALNISVNPNVSYIHTNKLDGTTKTSFKYFINIMKYNGNKTKLNYSPSLKTLLLSNLKSTFSVGTSKYISKISILHIINNSNPTTAITITLHTDRYAQLSEDADIVSALQAKNAALEGTGGSISLVSA